MIKIRFTDGRSSAITLEAPGKTIGRGRVNDIVIDNDGVAGFHADLRVLGDRVTITDVDTAGGRSTARPSKRQRRSPRETSSPLAVWTWKSSR